MARLLNKISFFVLLLVCQYAFPQGKDTAVTGPKPPVYQDYKGDSTFKDFYKRRIDVAKAQINRLKSGALLVRLKTNQKAIDQLQAAGNVDLATQVARETGLTNKAIIKAYLKEFTFCPVYFFFSQYSDSVKHKRLEGIFTDSNLVLNPNIVCHANFYLVAEQNSVYNSSIGLVPLGQAHLANEKGTASKEVAIVIKNRFYIQLHEPFPYYQKGYNIKKYADYVRSMNEKLTHFYEANAGFTIPSYLAEFVY